MTAREREVLTVARALCISLRDMIECIEETEEHVNPETGDTYPHHVERRLLLMKAEHLFFRNCCDPKSIRPEKKQEVPS